MIRALYRIALRLHPPSFRQRFTDEMLSIFDDEARWRGKLSLVVDGILSLARQWALRQEFWHENPAPSAAPASADGIPSFSSLDPFRPRAAALVQGLVWSTAVFCLTCFAIKYSWIHVLHVRIPEVQFERAQWNPASAGSRDLGEQALKAAADRQKPSSPLTPTDQHGPSSSPGKQEVAADRSPQTQVAQAATTVRLPQKEGLAESAAAERAGGLSEGSVISLDAAARHRVIEGAIANLRKHYVDAEVAQRMAAALRAAENRGDDSAETDGESFAAQLTQQMTADSHDKHLIVIYSASRTPEQPGPTPDDLARYRNDMKRNNCTFEKVEILPRNIGYVKLNSFPDPSICGSTAAAAMNRVGQADALIFDLRDNHGGDPKMVAFIASYLFDRPTHLNDLYTRAANKTQESWTQPAIPGSKLADKPVYVLTSASSFSGAEEFSYDLKMLKRAILVGETTAGGAHMVTQYRIDDNFMIMVPETRPINPISKTDWEGTGVEPDVKVKAAKALETANQLAQRRLHNR